MAVLVAVGGTALLVHQLSNQRNGSAVDVIAVRADSVGAISYIGRQRAGQEGASEKVGRTDVDFEARLHRLQVVT